MAKDFSPSPPPLTPPLTEEVKLSWLRLLRSHRVGPVTFHKLLAEYQTAEAALAALPGIARDAGLKDYTLASHDQVAREYEAGMRMGAQLLERGHPNYPSHLTEIADAPPLLWVLGQTEALVAPKIAIVGARNASSMGLRMARRLGHGLSEAGLCIVSGLARGIDTEAHMASAARGTIAVHAGGVDVIYPAQNAALAQEIADTGARVSEQPLHTAPQARHFPMRNRIISGMVTCVIVVEAAAKSGSLITARAALDQGREVLVVPGHPLDPRTGGCNMLLRDGATLVRSVEDVLDEVARFAAAVPADHDPPAPAARPARSAAEIRALHTEILSRLGPVAIAEAELAQALHTDLDDLGPHVIELEMQGTIHRDEAGQLTRLS